jgi:hypothetical protein
MRILNVFALVGVLLSISTLGGILTPALALEQPIDNNQTGTAIEPGPTVSLTSHLGSNMSNATAPAEYR